VEWLAEQINSLLACQMPWMLATARTKATASW